MKYLVLRNNYGYQGRYWEKDAIVDLPDDAKPPHHFEPVDKAKKATAQAAPVTIAPNPVSSPGNQPTLTKAQQKAAEKAAAKAKANAGQS